MQLCPNPASVSGSADICREICALVADADWLEAVSKSQHHSPNHDLCCRLLSHIPLLAAYTGWPSAEQHGIAEATTQPVQIRSSNGSLGVGKSPTEVVVESEVQATVWRPTEDDKKCIEEMVRSVVDREDLCRLLMVAMATELERPTSRGGGDQSIGSPSAVIQFGANSPPPEDFDHGDAVPHDALCHAHSVLHKRGQSGHEASDECEREFYGVEDTKAATAVEYLCDDLAGNEECRSDLATVTVGDGDNFQKGAIVCEDAMAATVFLSARSVAPCLINTTLFDSENPLPDVTDSGELTAQDLLWFGQESCNTEPPWRSVVDPPSKSLHEELLDAIRKAESRITIENQQANSPLDSRQQVLNSTADQTADGENTNYGSSRIKPQTLAKAKGVNKTLTPADKNSSSLDLLLRQNLESLSASSKHVSGTTTKPENTRIELPAKLSEAEVRVILTSFTVRDDANTDKFSSTDGDITVTETRQLLDFHGEDEKQEQVPNAGNSRVVECRSQKVPKHECGEKRDEIHDRHDPLSLAKLDRRPARPTDAPKERRANKSNVKVDGVCRVEFRPLPEPVSSPRGANPVPASLASPASSPYIAAPTRIPGPSSTSAGRHRKPRSTPHDLKCSQRRKSVAV